MTLTPQQIEDAANEARRQAMRRQQVESKSHDQLVDLVLRLEDEVANLQTAVSW